MSMKLSKITKTAALLALALWASSDVKALNITLGTAATRTATLGSATAGYTLSLGNTAKASDIDTLLGPTWTERADVTAPGGSTLKITLTSGTFGSSGPDAGTWQILDPNFWTTYGDAVITMHVGQGGDKTSIDNFVWQLTPGALSGSWSYDGSALKAGGLSNFKLDTRGTGRQVPDGGLTGMLLGIGALALGVARKSVK